VIYLSVLSKTMETRGLPVVTIFNACATVRQKHVVCVPEMSKVNLQPDMSHEAPTKAKVCDI
jgi:hypothetical protein